MLNAIYRNINEIILFVRVLAKSIACLLGKYKIIFGHLY